RMHERAEAGAAGTCLAIHLRGHQLHFWRSISRLGLTPTRNRIAWQAQHRAFVERGLPGRLPALVRIGAGARRQSLFVGHEDALLSQTHVVLLVEREGGRIPPDHPMASQLWLMFTWGHVGGGLEPRARWSLQHTVRSEW